MKKWSNGAKAADGDSGGGGRQERYAGHCGSIRQAPARLAEKVLTQDVIDILAKYGVVIE